MAGMLPVVHGEALITQLLDADSMLPAEPGDRKRSRGNAGLVFDRYLKVWEGAGSDRALMKKARQRPLEEFCYQYGGLAGSGKPLLAALHRRFETLETPTGADAGWACRSKTLMTRWRVVTGVGAEHPIENGFTFDHSLGVPYFPGSSVKGLCRASARHLADASKTELDRLFGGQPEETYDDHDASAGDLVFLPAYPARDHWPKLEVDIVNNHRPSYQRDLENGKAKPRAVETDSPVPVFFLVVAARTPFTFRVGSRSGSLDNVERGLAILEQGLDLLGLGAKTAAGYGTFEPMPAR